MKLQGCTKDFQGSNKIADDIVSLLKNLLEKANNTEPSSVSYRLQLAKSGLEQTIGRKIEIMEDETGSRGFEVDLSLRRMGDFLEETLKVPRGKAKIGLTLKKNSENSKSLIFLQKSALEKITSRCIYAG